LPSPLLLRFIVALPLFGCLALLLVLLSPLFFLLLPLPLLLCFIVALPLFGCLPLLFLLLPLPFFGLLPLPLLIGLQIALTLRFCLPLLVGLLPLPFFGLLPLPLLIGLQIALPLFFRLPLPLLIGLQIALPLFFRLPLLFGLLPLLVVIGPHVGRHQEGQSGYQSDTEKNSADEWRHGSHPFRGQGQGWQKAWREGRVRSRSQESLSLSEG
jgi:hypothetical protein